MVRHVFGTVMVYSRPASVLCNVAVVPTLTLQHDEMAVLVIWRMMAVLVVWRILSIIMCHCF